MTELTKEATNAIDRILETNIEDGIVPNLQDGAFDLCREDLQDTIENLRDFKTLLEEGGRMSQIVFLHIYPTINECGGGGQSVSVTANLAVSIYKDESDAQAALMAGGGMIVETTSDKLKGRIDDDVYLTTVDRELRDLDMPEENDRLPFASLVCGQSLPHIVKTAPDDATPEDIEEGCYDGYEAWKFEPDAEKWVNEFCDAADVSAFL